MVLKSLKKIGKNIQNIRKLKGLSQEKLGLGVSRNYIGMVERAEVNTPLKTLLMIAEILNVEPKIFFEL